jgi:hypothetical protein
LSDAVGWSRQFLNRFNFGSGQLALVLFKLLISLDNLANWEPNEPFTRICQSPVRFGLLPPCRRSYDVSGVSEYM